MEASVHLWNSEDLCDFLESSECGKCIGSELKAKHIDETANDNKACDDENPDQTKLDIWINKEHIDSCHQYAWTKEKM